jgi:hypothetical protein
VTPPTMPVTEGRGLRRRERGHESPGDRHESPAITATGRGGGGGGGGGRSLEEWHHMYRESILRLCSDSDLIDELTLKRPFRIAKIL